LRGLSGSGFDDQFWQTDAVNPGIFWESPHPLSIVGVIYTDEYDIYARLPAWGYQHKTVCHARGEYARDEDGDGFCEIHVNTMEGTWSLLRSWLRPHRGISQEKLPLYLGFFEFVHNARRRGKALLGALVAALVM
jgi:transposase